MFLSSAPACADYKNVIVKRLLESDEGGAQLLVGGCYIACYFERALSSKWSALLKPAGDTTTGDCLAVEGES